MCYILLQYVLNIAHVLVIDMLIQNITRYKGSSRLTQKGKHPIYYAVAFSIFIATLQHNGDRVNFKMTCHQKI